MEMLLQSVALAAAIAGAVTQVIRLLRTIAEMRRSRRGSGETDRNIS